MLDSSFAILMSIIGMNFASFFFVLKMITKGIFHKCLTLIFVFSTKSSICFLMIKIQCIDWQGLWLNLIHQTYNLDMQEMTGFVTLIFDMIEHIAIN